MLNEPVSIGSLEETNKLKELLEINNQNLFITEPWSGENQGGGIKWTNYISSPIAVHSTKDGKFWGGIETVTYTRNINGRPVTSSESALTGLYGNLNEEFEIDYAVDLSTIPYVNFTEEALDRNTSTINLSLIHI